MSVILESNEHLNIDHQFLIKWTTSASTFPFAFISFDLIFIYIVKWEKEKNRNVS